MKQREINRIIIHCSATPAGRHVTVADIDRWHRQRGFRKIGYHYVIYTDGSVHQGRDESETGAHCSGHNARSIGVCYIGGCDKEMKPADTRSEAQRKALKKLVSELLKRYPGATVQGHNQMTCVRGKASPGFDPLTCSSDCTRCRYAAKACPSFDVKKEFKNER